MRQLFQNLKEYKAYLGYAPKSILKTEVADTYLNWLWWFLDPLLFMLVYTFFAGFFFSKKVEYFPIFVFIGLNCWNFFDRSIKRGVTLVKYYKSIFSKIYVPKYIMLLVQMFVEGIKIAISYLLVIIMMLIYIVPQTWHILEAFPLFILLFILSFGGASIMLHFGVFINDLANIVTVILRLAFYLSGIFYDIGANKKIAENLLYSTILLRVNPIAMIMDGLRNCLLYGQSPDWLAVGIWTVLGVLLCAFGVHLIHKYESGYIKIS